MKKLFLTLTFIMSAAAAHADGVKDDQQKLATTKMREFKTEVYREARRNPKKFHVFAYKFLRNDEGFKKVMIFASKKYRKSIKQLRYAAIESFRRDDVGYFARQMLIISSD